MRLNLLKIVLGVVIFKVILLSEIINKCENRKKTKGTTSILL